MGHDAFISFCNLERRIADACVAALEAGGWTCWISHRDIVPGKDYGEAIIDAINEARCLVLIFSKSADESPHVLREVERAVNRRMPVVTFRVEDLAPRKALEYFLSSPHWLDAWTEPLEPHLERLGRTLEALLGPPTPPPAAPPPVEAPASTAPPTEREACPQCGAENSARAVFCPHCGLALVETCGFCGDEGRTALPYCAGCGANKPAYEQAAKLLAQAKAALQAHRYEEALTATTSGLELGELAEDLRVLAERARRHLTALEEFEPCLERHLEAADFDAASTLIEVVERSKPGDDRFERARERLTVVRRRHEVRETLEQARADLETDRRFKQALAGCAHALELEPGHAEAAALRERATQAQRDHAERLAAVERAQAEGDWESALAALESLAVDYSWSEEVGRRRDTVTRLQQREKRYRALKAGLPALLEAEDWKRARKSVDEILTLRPDDEEARAQREELKRKIVSRKAAGRAKRLPRRATALVSEGATAGSTVRGRTAKRFGHLPLLATVLVGIGLAVVLALRMTGGGSEAQAERGSGAAASESAALPVEEGDLAVAPAPHDLGVGPVPETPGSPHEARTQPVPHEAKPPAAGPAVVPSDAAEPEKPAASVAPDMLGWSRATAEAWCLEHGWSAVFGDAVTADPGAVGTIVGQVPGSGSPLAASDVFRLTVGVPGAPAAPPAMVTVAPDLLGWTRSRAEAWCRENGQLVEVLDQLTEDPGKVGTVVDQDPPPGEPLSASALFTLGVGVLKEAPPPSALAIGDVVPDLEFTTPGGGTLRLSSLTATYQEVREHVLMAAEAFGAKSPDLSTRLDEIRLLGAGFDWYPKAVYRFVSAIGRIYGLSPSPDDLRSIQSLDDVTRWVVSHVRDPIVLMPWSSRCFLCKEVDQELRAILVASGARFIALGGAYGDSQGDLRRIEGEHEVASLLVDDSSHVATDLLELHRTCQFVVLDANLKLCYRGVMRAGHQLPKGGHEEGDWLADAIEAAKNGKTCFVPEPTGFG